VVADGRIGHGQFCLPVSLSFQGTTEVHKRRERPHVILSNVTGAPIALVTALFERQVPANNATGGHGNDATYTLVQPIQQAETGGGGGGAGGYAN
jgi:hypothetical protein